jgi:hypothetical protein
MRSPPDHSPHCPGVVVMKEANRVEFASVQEAERARYRRAGDCWLIAGLVEAIPLI